MKKFFLLLFTASILLISCDKTDDADVVATNPNTTIVGFSKSVFSENFLTNLTSSTLYVPVSLIAYQNEVLPGEVSFTFAVEPNGTTAVAGVDYMIPTNFSSKISAGSNTVLVPITVYPTVFDPAAPKKLVLKMVSSNATIGSQYMKATITLQGVCPSLLEGNYTWTSGAGIVNPITVTKTGEGTYRASRFPYFISVYTWDFSDVCNNLNILTWEFQGSNPLTSTAVPNGVKESNGDLRFNNMSVGGTSVQNRSFVYVKI